MLITCTGVVSEGAANITEAVALLHMRMHIATSSMDHVQVTRQDMDDDSASQGVEWSGLQTRRVRWNSIRVLYRRRSCRQ